MQSKIPQSFGNLFAYSTADSLGEVSNDEMIDETLIKYCPLRDFDSINVRYVTHIQDCRYKFEDSIL